MASIRTLPEAIDDIRRQLAKRGALGYLSLQGAFDANAIINPDSMKPQPSTSVINPDSMKPKPTNDIGQDPNDVPHSRRAFEQILNKGGVFLPTQEVSAVYRAFGPTARGLMDAITVHFNQRRANMADAAWHAIAGNASAVPLAAIEARYQANADPAVISGRFSPASAQAQLRALFTKIANANTHPLHRTSDPAKVIVPKSAFDYSLVALSTVSTYDDEHFVRCVERMYNVQESTGARRAPPSMLSNVANVIKEKVRQRAGNRSEVTALRCVFRHYDSEDSGRIDFQSFLYGLERFGVVVAPELSRALFDALSKGADFIDYGYAAQQLCGDGPFGANPTPHPGPTGPNGGVSANPTPHPGPTGPNGSVSANPTPHPGPAETSLKPTVIFALGGPGAGVTTQCSYIAREFGFVHISVAEALKRESLCRPYSQHSGAIAEAAGKGTPVAGSVAATVIQAEMEKHVEAGSLFFVLDGFPYDADALATWGDANGGSIDVPFMIFLDAGEKELMRRLIAQGDSVSTFNSRFQTFRRSVLPIVAHWHDQGMVRTIDAQQPASQVYNDIRKEIASISA